MTPEEVHKIHSRLRQWREDLEEAEICYNCSTLLAFEDLLDDAEEMEEMLLAWQNWWDGMGFQWYVDGEFPQHEKPPFLRDGNEMFQKWIKDE